jgi:hypothetical protein
MNSESEAEDAFIQSHILPDTYLWIGLNDLDIEGYWGWTTGEEMVHTGWDPASSQPDSGATVTGTPDEDCVLMTMSGWHDYVCTSAVDYNGHICEVYAPQSLVCSIDEDSVDADDDAITYTFEWTANGTPFTAARTTVHPGDTVPNITGSEDETWVCTVTPNDGEIDGESATVEYGDDEEPCYGNERSCPGLSCLDILESGFSTGDGNYWINPDSAGVFDVYCDMTTDGGGWTMTAVSSSDGTETWTWNNRHYWDTDTTTFGSLDATNRDFKSPALHSVTGTGLLFTHAPSGEWAAYDGISTDSTLADMVAAAGEPVCYDESEGFPMTAGTLEDIAGVEEMIPSQLCSTNLYFNARDRDGSTGCPDGDRDHAYGPAWNGRGCYFDDVGNLASLGPATNAGSDGHSADLEYGHPMHEAVGFGYLLDLNTGSSDAAENYIQVFIR